MAGEAHGDDAAPADGDSRPGGSSVPRQPLLSVYGIRFTCDLSLRSPLPAAGGAAPPAATLGAPGPEPRKESAAPTPRTDRSRGNRPDCPPDAAPNPVPSPVPNPVAARLSGPLSGPLSDPLPDPLPDLEVLSSDHPPEEVTAAPESSSAGSSSAGSSSAGSSSPGSSSSDSSSPDSSGEPPGRVLWQSPERDPDDRPATVLRRIGPWDVLRFPGIADFHLRDRRIVVVPAADASPALVELRLLGPVLAYWLERRGVLTLHASGVVLDGRAVGFLAGNHAGKTSLALELVEQGGALLTDDLLAVEAQAGEGGRPFLARPGYPQVRLWVPDAERLLPGRGRDLPTVHPAYDKRRVPIGEGGVGRFHPDPAPLAAVFLPEHRTDVDRLRVEPLTPPQAVLALLTGSYLPRLAPAAGLQEQRLDLLARLVEAVPVRRMVYPRGVEKLPQVAEDLRRVLAGAGPTVPG